MLNRNRCILCTRCVGSCAKSRRTRIGIVDHGYGSEIATFQEEGVHSLLSGNLMDVCLVGAITTRDYRFKSRPWDNPTPSTRSARSARRAATHGVAEGEAGMGRRARVSSA